MLHGRSAICYISFHLASRLNPEGEIYKNFTASEDSVTQSDTDHFLGFAARPHVEIPSPNPIGSLIIGPRSVYVWQDTATVKCQLHQRPTWCSKCKPVHLWRWRRSSSSLIQTLQLQSTFCVCNGSLNNRIALSWTEYVFVVEGYLCRTEHGCAASAACDERMLTESLCLTEVQWLMSILSSNSCSD